MPFSFIFLFTSFYFSFSSYFSFLISSLYLLCFAFHLIHPCPHLHPASSPPLHLLFPQTPNRNSSNRPFSTTAAARRLSSTTPAARRRPPPLPSAHRMTTRLGELARPVAREGRH
jgi:hypothetical protein